MAFHVDGISRPDQPFTPDFANNKYVESFLSLSRGVGNDRKNTGNYIDIREYPKAYARHVFDVHGTRHDNVYAQPSKVKQCLRSALQNHYLSRLLQLFTPHSQPVLKWTKPETSS